MRRNICLILVFVIAVVAVGFTSYRWGFNDAAEESVNMEPPTADLSESISKIDYPLIDIAFNDGNDWDVVIIDGIYEQNRTYLLCTDAGELQEHLAVMTYPAGRGTTGHSCVIVYKNGQEVKSVECFEIYYGNKELENKFKRISEAEFVEFSKGR